MNIEEFEADMERSRIELEKYIESNPELKAKIKKIAHFFDTPEPPIRKTPLTKEEIDIMVKEEMDTEFPEERTL